MRVKKIMIPMITMVIIASQLMGCAATSQNELLSMLERGREIEIEVAVPINEEQGEENALTWEQLALLSTNPEIRSSWEDIIGVIGVGLGKNGVVYINTKGEQDPNNTLRIALHNRAFQQFLEDESSLQALAEAVQNNYVDIEAGEEEKAIYMGINAYFNLLPDAEPAYANPDATLSRGEFMAMVMRSETPVSGDIKLDTAFTDAVGSTQYNFYAQELAKDSYLTTADKSLNNMTYNGTITRAEVIYTLMNHYFSDELETIEVNKTGVALTDVKDGGDIASEQGFDKGREYWKSYELVYATQNPADGIPTDLYKALVLANQKGIISSETRWDEGITKSEAVGILVETLKLDPSIALFNASNGITPETAVAEAENTEPATTVNGSMASENVDLTGDEWTSIQQSEKEQAKEADKGLNESTGIEIIEELNIVMYAKENCNGYDGDGINYDLVYTFAEGSELQITARTTNNWYRVGNANDGLYIEASKLTTTKPATESNTTIVEPETTTNSVLTEDDLKAFEEAMSDVHNTKEVANTGGYNNSNGKIPTTKEGWQEMFDAADETTVWSVEQQKAWAEQFGGTWSEESQLVYWPAGIENPCPSAWGLNMGAQWSSTMGSEKW